MNDRVALSLDNLCFGYEGGNGLVLRHLSLEIPSATVTAILGPNGSGKTTLMHLLLGILTPTKGAIIVAGQPHHRYSRRSLSQTIGLVPQEENLSFDFSVIEYVTLGRAPYLGLMGMPTASDRQIAQQALETVGLDHLGHRAIPSLSGGECQLAMVARALTQEPRIILLDEPTSHLDLANRRRVLDVLTALAKKGVTVVFTSHDPNAAAVVADQVVLLRDGQAVAAGPTRQVFNSEALSTTYGVPIEVVEVRGQPLVLA